jgi:DNA-directed RNA polymerase subunit M/transcription elongation factor TFIIS
MWYIIYKNSKEVITMREELLKGLSEEQIKKLENCKDSEEILALAKEEGVTLSDEQLEAVSGGCGDSKIKCPKCGSSNINVVVEEAAKTTLDAGGTVRKYRCLDCNHKWEDKV